MSTVTHGDALRRSQRNAKRKRVVGPDVDSEISSPEPTCVERATGRKTRKGAGVTRADPSSSPADADASSPTPWYVKFTKSDPLYLRYMSTEWGFEKRSDVELFEKLSLEGAQSGLSWRTILHKREAYRRAFHGFDVERVAQMSAENIDLLIAADGTESSTGGTTTMTVVRHRGKLESVVSNARLILKLKSEGTIRSIGAYLWSFVDDKPILNRWERRDDVPSKSEESERMSKALKKHGFKFVGPTTCYSLMQSCGFVIDHPVGTTQWAEAEKRVMNREGGYQER